MIIQQKDVLEYIRFTDCKVRTIHTGNESFASLRQMFIALGVNSNTLKGIVRNHSTQQYKFWRKGLGTDIS